MLNHIPALLLAAAAVLSAAEPRVIFHEDFSRAATGGLPEGWQFWSPRPTMQLATAARPGAFRMAGNGNPHAKGRLWRTLAGFEPGAWYRFEARYAADKVPNPANAALAVVQLAGNQSTHVLTIDQRSGGNIRAALVLQMPAKAGSSLEMHLFAGFIPQGSIEWQEVKVSHLAGYAPPSRPVRLAVIDSQPPRKGPAEASARHYAAEIDRACAGSPRTDLVLLPENFNKSKVEPEAPVTMDSEYMRIVREAARRNKVYLAGSLFEERDGVAFNAGFVIDRQGQPAGYYRKSHLTIGEMLFSQISRGDDLNVIRTDFGVIGLSVCFDFHFPESARLLALQGAELLLVPMASDGRLKEDGMQRGAEHAGKTYVLENRIPVVFAATLGSTVQPSLIIDQNGVVLARSNSENHIIRANLDLAAKSLRWSGNDFRSIHQAGRRPELYRRLGPE